MYLDVGGGYEDVYGVRCFLPKKPANNQILGYNLKKRDQKFKRLVLPDWYEDRRMDEEYEQDKQQKLVDSGELKQLTYFDPVCEKFRMDAWKRRLYGTWTFINGKAYYLTGPTTFYLDWCRGDHPQNDGYPIYYDSIRSRFYFRERCQYDPYCLGYIMIGPRGYGKTTEEVSIVLNNMTMPPHRSRAALQSKSEDDARDTIMKGKMIPMFNELPHFFKPTFNHGSNPETYLSFFRTRTGGKKARKVKHGHDYELGNRIAIYPAKEKALDGKTLQEVINDEVGKCLKINTPILMHDGEIKKVQYVEIGDTIMGNDSTQRTVLGLGRGSEMCYDIVPNKGEKWGCNESHILSLKWCHNQPGIIVGKRYNKYEVVNITVKDYLNLTPGKQKHLMLYKVPVEYEKKEHLIDPYFLGLWLGDGNSKQFAIYNMDQEIDDYLIGFSKTHNLKLKRVKGNKLSENFWRYNFIGRNVFLANYFLTVMRLKNNKHIPNNYLNDSRNNRLRLLAGLLDTDGSLNLIGNRMNYEITQKNKILADQILRLVQSLGFGGTIHKKIVNNTDYWRTTIFGHLWEIPVKIERKKAPKIEKHHKNRRNPLHSGFKVVQTGVEEYFGFSIDGNRLFLLGDYTVTHNTSPSKEADVYKRMLVNRFTVYRNHQKIGLIRAMTTVEEMDEGGKECFKIWNSSNPDVRTSNGYTLSGLYRMFVSDIDITVKPGIVDEFGFVDKKKAIAFHDGERKSREHDAEEYNSYVRKNPRNADEAFITDASKCLFNYMILFNRYQELIGMKDKPYVKGDLYWVDGKVDGEVAFARNDKNGKFRMSKVLDAEGEEFEGNRKLCNNIGYEVDSDGKKQWFPKNDRLFSIGTDPIRFTKTLDGRASKAGSHGFEKYNDSIDKDIEREKWTTHNIIWEYLERPAEPEDYAEDMIMACRYWGCSINPESNVGTLKQHFRMRGYDKFLMVRSDFDDNVMGGKKDDEPYESNEEVINSFLAEIQAFVNRHGHRIPFERTVSQLMEYTIKERTKFDLVPSLGFALFGSRKRIDDDWAEVDLDDIMDVIEYDKGQLVVRERETETEISSEWDF